MFKARYLTIIAIGGLFATQVSAVDFYSVEIYYDQVFSGGFGLYSINDVGDACGRDNSAGEAFAIIDDVYIPLPTDLPCRGINNSGQIVFERRDENTVNREIRAYLYEFDATTNSYVETAIPIVGGQGNVFPQAINNAGQVTGWASDTDNRARAFIWDKTNGISLLGDLGTQSRAYGMNDSGDIVGMATVSGTDRPFLYTSDDGMQILTAVTCGRAYARAINNAGTIVGTCNDGTGNNLPFVIRNGVYEEPVGPYDDQGLLRAINNSGVAVGIAHNSAGGFDPAVWDVDNGLRLLSELRLTNTGTSLPTALAINDSGLIVAGNLLLTPVLNVPPEFDIIPPQNTVEGAQVLFTLTATDRDNSGQLSYRGLHLTAVGDDDSLGAIGAALDPVSGVFSWTPGFDQAGNYEFEFTVTDEGNPVRIDMITVMITVGNINRPPVIEDIAPATIQVGETLVVDFVVSDPDNDLVDLNFTNLPAGASLSEEQLTLTWAPTSGQVGTFALEIVATDRGTPPLSTTSYLTVTVGNDFTPEELIELITTTITDLGLPNGPANKLLKIVQKIDKHFGKGKVSQAINEANKFISDVNDDVNNGIIAADDGADLISLAQQLIDLLNGAV